MTRILSAAILLPILFGTVWYLPPIGTLVLAEIAALLAFVEYAALAASLGTPVPRVLSGAAVLATCASVGLAANATEIVLLTARERAGRWAGAQVRHPGRSSCRVPGTVRLATRRAGGR